MLIDAQQIERRGAIVRILRGGLVRRQQDLVRLLKKAGLEVTQSSISRDLRELGVLKASGRYVLPPDEKVARQRRLRRARAVRARSCSRAGPSITVLRTTIGAAQSVAVAIDKAEWPEVVGTISGDDTIFIATASARAQEAAGRPPARPVPDLKPCPILTLRGRHAHRARLFRRTRHLVPGAVARRALRPSRHHRHGGYRRHRCGSRAHAARALPRARRHRASSGRCARRLLRAGAALPHHGQRAPRPALSAVRRRRARHAGADHRPHGARARHRHDRARLHRRRQRPGALRSGAAHARAASWRCSRRCATTPSSARRSSSTCSSAEAAGAAVRRGLLDQPRPVGRHHRRHARR